MVNFSKKQNLSTSSKGAKTLKTAGGHLYGARTKEKKVKEGPIKPAETESKI